MQNNEIEFHQVRLVSQQQYGVAVQVEALDKSYQQDAVLRQLHLKIAPGEFVAIVGKSGCGKSTLLRHLAGLDQADAGQILVDGTPRHQPHDNTRMMFQEARLLPWKTVLENVGLGLSGQWRVRAQAALDDVGLSTRVGAWPSVLSGGQRQRVALARALVHAPRLLLLDEPLGALDALTRIEMQSLVEKLWLQRGFTSVLVTHDVSEAVALADRVVLIENGAVSLDVAIALARPRKRGSAEFAALEGRVLSQVLARGSD